MKENQIFINKRVYVVLSVLEITKIAISGILYDYVKSEYEEKAKL